MPWGGGSNLGGVLDWVMIRPEVFGVGGSLRVTVVGWPVEIVLAALARTPGSWVAMPSITGATLRGRYARLTQSTPSPGWPPWITAFHWANRAGGISISTPEWV